MATGSFDRTVRLWNVVDPANTELFGPPLLGSAAGVWTVVFGADGRSVIVAAEDALRVWQLPTGQRLLPDGAQAVVTAADGVRVTATGVDGAIRVWTPIRPNGRCCRPR